MAEFFNKKKESDEILKAGGTLATKNESYTDADLERANSLLRKIGKNEQDGFFFLIGKTVGKEYSAFEGMVKVTNANKVEMLDIIMESFDWKNKEILNYVRLRVERGDNVKK